jgi:hypothetical protein
MSQVPIHLHRAAWSALGSIPGCALDTVVWAGSRTTCSRVLVVRGTGWSPSLHRVGMAWEIDLSPDVAGRTYETDDNMLDLMSVRLEEQRRRSLAGCALGAPVPLRVDGGAPSPVDHLVIDVSLMALLADMALRRDQDMDRAVTPIGHAVCALHEATSDHDGGHAILGRETQVSCSDVGRLVSPSWHMGEDRIVALTSPAGRYASMAPPPARRPGDAPTVTMSGSTVLVSGAILPETALAGAPGRRVGDLVDIHPLLHDRIVDKAHGGDGWFAVSMTEAVVRIGDVAKLSPAEALSKLRAMTGGPGRPASRGGNA